MGPDLRPAFRTDSGSGSRAGLRAGFGAGFKAGFSNGFRVGIAGRIEGRLEGHNCQALWPLFAVRYLGFSLLQVFSLGFCKEKFLGMPGTSCSLVLVLALSLYIADGKIRGGVGR